MGTEMVNRKSNGTTTEHIQDSAVSLPPQSEFLLHNRFCYWTSTIPGWTACKTTKNSSLRFACIVESRLAQGLKFEGEMLLLTPHNWKYVLRYARLDFLLVESTWISATGHWHTGQFPASPHYAELVDLVKLAKERSIPTVFWMTKGHEYHEHFRDFARHFDLICCADPLEAELLKTENLKAEVLLPCVQPALFNPFRMYGYHQDIGLKIIFDGWADIVRHRSNLSVLKRLKSLGLGIIESQYEIFKMSLDFLPGFENCVLGQVTAQERLTALKYAQSYATLSSGISLETTRQWMALEAAACRLPVVHHGTLHPDDIRCGFTIECKTEDDFVLEFTRQHKDDLYRKRVGHLGWRNVHLNHTFSHRIRVICRLLGINNDWDEFPKASVITPTNRTEYLQRAFATYDALEYPNKEFILVYNENFLPTYHDLGLEAPRPDVVICHLPSDVFRGASLNFGHVNATGKYLIPFDDDDHYSKNYVLDMVLGARCIDASLFGKLSAPLIFEGEDSVYVVSSQLPFVIVDQSTLQEFKCRFSGNSISGSSTFFRAHGYHNNNYGSADTVFQISQPSMDGIISAFMDEFNMAAVRRKDIHSHTWKSNEKALKKGRCILRNIEELVV